MKNNILILLLTVLFFTNVVFAVKVADMPDLLKPDIIQLEGDDLFVVEKTTCSIHIYSLKTLKLKYKLGKKGEGPGEFRVRPRIQLVTPNYIFGCARHKGIWFSREGKIIKEKVFDNPNFRMLTPVNHNYAAILLGLDRQTGGVTYILILLNSQFERIKEITRVEDTSRLVFRNQPRETLKIDLLLHHVGYWIYDDKIFFANSKKGFYFDVFDHQGNHLYSIDKNDQVEKIEVDDAYKNKVLDYIKLHRKDFYESYRSNFTFLKHLPAIKSFLLSDKKIFVSTYKEKDGMHELIILDLKGKILDRIFLPLKSIRTHRSAGGDIFTVHKGVLYELVENEETEMWELHKTDLSSVQNDN